MIEFKYEMELLSDAEPSSGFGTELLNGVLPRNQEGKVYLPASHVKGILRENLANWLCPLMPSCKALIEDLFGREGDANDGGLSAQAHISSAVLKDKENTIIVTRTKIDEKTGIAEEKSLRTSEALGSGSKLGGSVLLNTDDQAQTLAIQFALLSLSGIGGSRTRGAGRCRVKIDGVSETPGAILRKLTGMDYVSQSSAQKECYSAEQKLDSDSISVLRLEFKAEQPLLLPERPLGKSNVIASDFKISSTAVAGTLITLLSRIDNNLASACYNADNFRCFPLLPVPESSLGKDELPVYVSNTHKISKLSIDKEHSDEYYFGDTMIPDDYSEDYRWQEQTRRLSMKGVDGVMLVEKNNRKIGLLRRGEIPVLLSAHAVINGSQKENGRSDNLFTTEATCAKSYAGLVIMPKEAADKLLPQLTKGMDVHFGKSRSMMGGGKLYAKLMTDFARSLLADFPQVEKLRNRLFIVQAPIVYTETEHESSKRESSKDVINRVLAKSGWGEVEKESVMTSVLFGWNQSVRRKGINGSCRTQAQRVILPGSVFLLKEEVPDEELFDKIVHGLGEDAYGGYGAVIPHPNFARRLCHMESSEQSGNRFASPKDEYDTVILGYKLKKTNEGMLSASQISRLSRIIASQGIEGGRTFLKEQREYRPERIRKKWEKVADKIIGMLNNNKPQQIVDSLRIWHDLTVAQRAEEK